ncbi:MAG: PhoH family protein [Sulfuricurvum sp.]|uniref:PhoH family protein n=1 Tax=Sulfuricurvum sp. TaxID=2025608 RepID=UPI0026016E1E|nr:PhoH family protein [Sulfuricurvum sp.]MDD2829537.1 PhoH family protein [Sulfuricurvum sp.]MDD4950469.1 PhoH family protein [Sulfuricurvum sp.]
MSDTQKCYLLDTSVILDDPTNILRISQENANAVVITNIVLAELNSKKDDIRSEAGYMAREFFRLADVAFGEPIAAIELPECILETLDTAQCKEDRYYRLDLKYDRSLHGGEETLIELIIIHREHYRISSSFTEPKGINDAKIGEIADDYDLTLLTNDMSFRIASEIRGIPTESIRNSSVESPESIDFNYTYTYTETPEFPTDMEHHNFNQLTFIQQALSSTNETYETGIQRHAFSVNNNLEWCDFDRRFGEHFDDDLVRPLNLEQKFYYSMMTHPQNYVTVVAGSTGSGKTLVALQAGLELVSEGIVEGIVYARNTVTSNDQQAELGFRKGDEEQKLGYFMYPLYSAINFTIEHQSKRSIDARVEYTGNTNSVKRENATETFMKKYNIEVMDIAHMRGTTISRKFVIIDEAQNMTNATLKLIGTRMGDETRLVVMGDPGQIDHPFLSKRRNALVTLLNKAQHSNFIGGIQLRHTIRSNVADWFDKNF